MTIDQATKLLNIIEDIDTISEDTLKSKKRAAQRRWHPDMAPSQDEATLNRFKETFQKIEVAVACILSYQKNGYVARDNADFAETGSQNEQKEAQDRQSATTWKVEVQKRWANIKAVNWRIDKRDTILSDGFSVYEQLKQDLKDRTPALGFTSIFGAFYLFMALSFLAIFLPFLFYIITPLFFIHTIFCVLVALPLSIIWLPEWLYKIAAMSCDAGLEICNFIRNTPRIRRFVDWPYYFSIGILLVFITPLYNFVGKQLKNKVVGIQKKTIAFFGDYDVVYVEDLIKKDPAQMSRSEINDLFRVYNMALSFN